MTDLTEEKLLDLLCKKATSGLNADESNELERLETAFPAWKNDLSFETAAAAINLIVIDPRDKMPDHLKARILASSEEFVGRSGTAERFTPENAGGGRLSAAIEEYGERARTSFAQWLGWGAAAVACLALAFNLYLTRYQAPDLIAGAGTQTIQTPPAELSDAQKFEQLKSSGKAITIAVASADPKKPGAISGDIVWSGTEQKGYMRFRGMPVNDPTTATYQLWIFDEAQDEKYPVDGGVFDINKDGEVIVPIDAKINVKNPKLFAVTKEKPGGVVVSDRKGLIAIAKV